MRSTPLKMAIVLIAVFSMPQLAQAASPKNPLVLVHGWSGTASYLNVVSYWYNFGSTLRRAGIPHYTASVSSYNSDEVRGRQLNNYIRSLKATTGYTKFNLVGHSQGGITIRKTAHDMPESVTSLTTISSPHLGWKVADWALQQSGSGQQVAAKLGNIVGNSIAVLSGLSPENDFMASMRATSTAGRAEFNRKYPTSGVGKSWCTTGEATGVVSGYPQRYYSYTGNRVQTNFFDLSDFGLKAVDRNIMRGEENDGFVRVCSSKFGNYLGNYNWNHLDEVNLFFGLRGWFSPDPRYVLVNHARRLASDGL